MVNRRRIITIIHVIVGVDVGGAELMMMRLIKSHHDSKLYRHTVVSLTDIGKVGLQLQGLGVEVKALGMQSLLDIPRTFWALFKFIRENSPDIVQTWMYHADLLGGLAARMAGISDVLWGIRCSTIPHRRISTTQVVASICSALSPYLPSVIVCCAESARESHISRGYDSTKMVVITNGYELTQFTIPPTVSRQNRINFGFGGEDVVIGIVGRFDRQKDHLNFVNAAAELSSKNEHVKFLMLGRDIDSANTVLNNWISKNGINHRFVLAGERDDIPECLACMDVFCMSSSCGEGFPNVVCEAMLVGLPCVVTDVGDAAQIVADTGIVVEPRDSVALANALQTMIDLGKDERLKLGFLGRCRVEKKHSIGAVSAQFELLYRNCLIEP